MISLSYARLTMRGALILILCASMSWGLLVPVALGEEESAIFQLVLEDVEGNELKVGELLREGAVILDFWATWCKPCQRALPRMQEIHHRYRDRGLTVIGISVDGPRNFSKVRPFATRLQLDFPQVIDRKGDLQREFKVTAIPTTILYNSSGEVVKIRQGYRPGEAMEYAELLEEMLPVSPADSLGSTSKSDTTGTTDGGF